MATAGDDDAEELGGIAGVQEAVPPHEISPTGSWNGGQPAEAEKAVSMRSYDSRKGATMSENISMLSSCWRHVFSTAVACIIGRRVEGLRA